MSRQYLQSTQRLIHADGDPTNNDMNNLDYAMSKRELMIALPKEDLMALVTKQGLRELYAKRSKEPAYKRDISKQELMEAYDRLKGKKKGRTQLEENGFVIACPHCQNHDLEKIALVEAMVEFRSITKVENGTIYFGDSYDNDWTGDQHFECKLCHQDFAIPTKAKTDHDYV